MGSTDSSPCARDDRHAALEAVPVHGHPDLVVPPTLRAVA